MIDGQKQSTSGEMNSEHGSSTTGDSGHGPSEDDSAQAILAPGIPSADIHQLRIVLILWTGTGLGHWRLFVLISSFYIFFVFSYVS